MRRSSLLVFAILTACGGDTAADGGLDARVIDDGSVTPREDVHYYAGQNTAASAQDDCAQFEEGTWTATP